MKFFLRNEKKQTHPRFHNDEGKFMKWETDMRISAQLVKAIYKLVKIMPWQPQHQHTFMEYT